MAEIRQIESLSQAGPAELVAQRVVLNGHAHDGNPPDQPEEVACHRFSFQIFVNLSL